MIAVEINRAGADTAGYEMDIDYVLDQGNSYSRHVVQMYDSIKKLPELARFRRFAGLQHGFRGSRAPGR